jgi:hypothetical protein
MSRLAAASECKRRLVARLILLAVAGFVSGCASSEQVRDRQIAARQAEEQADDAKCKEEGEADTPAYTQCRDRLNQKRAEQQAQQAKRNEAFQRTLGEGTSALSGH